MEKITEEIKSNLGKVISSHLAGSRHRIYLMALLPLAAMLVLSFWAPGLVVFVFLSCTAAITGFILALSPFFRDTFTSDADRVYRLLANNIDELIIVQRLSDEANVFVSPSIADLLAYDPEEIITSFGTFILHPEDRKQIKNRMSPEKLSNSSSFSRTVRVQKKDQTYLWMDLQAKAVFDDSGKADYVILAFRDASERHRVEQATKRFAEDLLKQKKNRKHGNSFKLSVLMASHDIKEPLRTLAGYSRLLKEKYLSDLDDSGQSCVYEINNAAQRMLNMMDNIMAFTSMQSSNRQIGQVRMDKLLYSVMKDLGALIKDKSAVVTYEELPAIYADEHQLRHLFQNLMDNALRFCSDEKPKIHVSWEKSEDAWCFKIQDNGPGISPEYHQSIFDLFRKIPGKGNYTGTGMGLSISKRIVENHGGKIWVESDGNSKGSVFHVRIPVEQGQVKPIPEMYTHLAPNGISSRAFVPSR